MVANQSDAARSSGIYGLFNLDGAPIDTHDAQLLGVTQIAERQSWQTDGHDNNFPNVISSHHSAAGFTLLVGEVEEAEALCALLGLQRGIPNAELAQAALARFGTELPATLTGEWSLLNRAPNGTLTLMLSAAKRDRMHYAVMGNRIAVAPNLFAITRLDWVDTTIDEAGLLFPLGRSQVRAARGATTMIAAVFQLEAGTSVTIQPDGRIKTAAAQILVEQPRWQGCYDDAVAETEHLLRDILRAKLGRNRCVASTLSGGLDSSLLTWLGAEECASDTRLLALTSVAPPGSGISDEVHFADLVAKTLGIRRDNVFPAHNVNIYRPPETILAGGSGPILSNRHCLTNALQMAAQGVGATLMLDGTYGELSATARLYTPGPMRQLRMIAAKLLRSTSSFNRPQSERLPFHVRLAPHRMAQLPEPLKAALIVPAPSPTSPKSNGLMNYVSVAGKALSLPNEFYPGAVRMAHPYRDIRLLKLFAGFPLQMLVKGGADRGVARSMMAGHLPDAIRLRRGGMPASPDHLTRLQRQADAARLRISLFRKSEVDDWLDLDWLDVTLQSVAANGPVNVDQANEVQLTAIAAEFLLWWRQQT